MSSLIRNAGARRPPALSLLAVFTALFAMLALVSMTSTTAHAASGGAVTIQGSLAFDGPEWVTDRAAPASWNAAGNTLTVQISDTTAQNYTGSPPGCFACTEGQKRAISPATAVEADLYLDPAWEGVPVRAGLWVRGAGGASSYGIIEFTTGSNLGAASNATTTTGIRFWDTLGGTWQFAAADASLGSTVTLGVALNAAESRYDYFVNGAFVGSFPNEGSETGLVEVFLNHYNYGSESEPGIIADGYAVAPYSAQWSNMEVSYAYASIQDAVDAAGPGDTIRVGAGTYEENVVIATSNITLQGDGSGITTIAPSAGSAIALAGHTAGEIEGVSIRGFTLAPAAGLAFIALSGTVDVAPTTLSLGLDDIRANGAAVVLNAVDGATLNNVVVENVPASGEAGALELTGVANLTVSNSTFSNNARAVRLQSTDGLVPIEAYGNNGAIAITGTSFLGNTEAIVNGDAIVTINAQGNWWGSASGPAAGSVVGNVNVSNHCVQADCGTPPPPPPPPTGGGDPPPPPPPSTIEETGGVVLEVEEEETTTIAANAPASVAVTSSNGTSATVNVPAGALPTGATVTVTALASTEDLLEQAPPPAGASVALAFAINAASASGEAITEGFNEPIQLEFEVPASAAPEGAAAGEIVLAFWNGTEWVEVDAVVTVNPDGSLSISASVTHFTLFAVFHQEGRGTFSVSPRVGLTLTVWGGGPASLMSGADGYWFTLNGKFVAYIPGALSVANAAFFAAFPEGRVPAGTPLLAVLK